MTRFTAALLLSACTFHPGETRGTSPEARDPLLGSWRVADSDTTETTITFDDGGRFIEDLPLGEFISGTTWRRETERLITIFDAQAVPETVQVGFTEDRLVLQWRDESAAPQPRALVLADTESAP